MNMRLLFHHTYMLLLVVVIVAGGGCYDAAVATAASTEATATTTTTTTRVTTHFPRRRRTLLLKQLRGGEGGGGGGDGFSWGPTRRAHSFQRQRQPSSSSSQYQYQQQQQQQQQTDESDRTATKEMLDAFLTRDSRNTFIARVYAILAGQLAVTSLAVIAFGLESSPLRDWTRANTAVSFAGGGRIGLRGIGPIVPMLSLILSTICWFVMCVSGDARRRSPLKWQLLSLFTIGEAVSVGFITSFYQFRSVLSAMFATAASATAVSVYTATQKNPKYDLSQWGAGLSSCGLIFLLYGTIQLLQMIGWIPFNLLPYNDALYGLIGACLFSFYLAYHTKLIVAGKHTKYQMNEKDYVFGAMTLYNDIINMFIYILRLIGEDRRDSSSNR